MYSRRFRHLRTASTALVLAVVAAMLSPVQPVGAASGPFVAPFDSTGTGGVLATSIVSADLNDDQFLDVAVGHQQSTDISILIGDGAGGLSYSTRLDTDIPEESDSLIDLQTADFNGDDLPDLVAAFSTESQVEVFLNPGSGVWDPYTSYPMGSPGSPTALAVGDLNDDENPDLVTVAEQPLGADKVSVRLGDGLGSFGPELTQLTDSANEHTDVQVVDVNDDGDEDVVIADTSANAITVMLSNGNGTFQSMTTYDLSGPPLSATSPMMLASGDMDEDGHIDLVTNVVNSTDERAILVLTGSPTGAFTPGAPVSVGGQAYRPHLVDDFDGDDHLDVVVAGAEELVLLPGTGTGSFAEPQSSPAGEPAAAATAGLFDDDDQLDVAVANIAAEVVTVYLNQLPSLLPALVPSFGPATSTAGGFTVQVTNYEPTYEWTATAPGASASISGTGLVTVSGLLPGASSTVTVSTAQVGYASGDATTTASALAPSLDPTFGTPTRTADGFTVNIANHDPAYTWNASATGGGTAAIDAGGLLTVTGLAPNASSTVTVTTTRTGYLPGSGEITESALAPALDPTFGTATPTADGFTVPVTNHDPAYIWNATATGGGTTSMGAGGLLTVGGLAPGASSTLTVTTTRAGYASGSGQVTATALAQALDPTFDLPTSTADGFTAQITNYDAGYSWNATATGAATATMGASGLVTVTGLDPGSSSTVTVTTSRTGSAGGTGEVTGSALSTGLTPQFGTPTRTADGYTVPVTNHDPAYTWSATATAGGTASVDGSGVLTVTGVAPGTASTATVSTNRPGYQTGSAPITESALAAALDPAFGTVTRTPDGFTVPITNHDPTFTWNATATGGATANVGTDGLLTVTGVDPGNSSTVTVTTTRAGYVGGTGQVSGSALSTGRVPTFAAPTPTADGFTVAITNHDPDYTWDATTDGPASASIDGSGLLTVTGLAPGASTTVTVSTSREGYTDEEDEVTGTALAAALDPTFGAVTRTTQGFTVMITNHDPAYSWNATATNGALATIDVNGLLTVTGLDPGNSSTVTVTTTRAGYAGGTGQATGSALSSALTPAFGIPTPTADGFTVDVTNHDPAYTWTAAASGGGTAVLDPSGHVTVTGLAPAAGSTVTVTTTRSGYGTGSAQVSASALAAALTPTFATPAPTADGFSVQATNHDPDFTWTVSASAGTATIDPLGLVTVTGLNPGASSTVTVNTSREGHAPGSGNVTASALGVAPPTDEGRPTPGTASPITVIGGQPVQLPVFTGPTPSPLVSIAGTATGQGAWATTATGHVYATGDAQYFGGLGAVRLNAPIVGLTPTLSGRGYYLVATDGGVFAFGDAVYQGSMGGTPLNRPVTSIVAACTGTGYYLVADDGGVFSFGGARFHGSMGGTPLNKHMIGLVPTCSGDGYWTFAADGGVFSFGSAPFFGSLGSAPPPSGVVGMVPDEDGSGYWLISGAGQTYHFPS